MYSWNLIGCHNFPKVVALAPIFITSTAATYFSPNDCINTVCRISLTIDLKPAENSPTKSSHCLAQYQDIQLYLVWDNKYLCILGSNVEVATDRGKIPSIALS